MKTLITIILGIILFSSCVHQKEITHFAIEDHTFEEACIYFDSTYRANHPEEFNVVIVDNN